MGDRNAIKLYRLAGEFLDGRISAAGLAELEELLQDKANRKLYLEFGNLQHSLYWTILSDDDVGYAGKVESVHRAIVGDDRLDGTDSAVPAARVELDNPIAGNDQELVRRGEASAGVAVVLDKSLGVPTRGLEARGPVRQLARDLALALAFVAATVVGLAYADMLRLPWGDQPEVAASNPETLTDEQVNVAVLTESVDCRWAVTGSSANPATPSFPMQGGLCQMGQSLWLQQGLAEFRLDIGMRMVVEGPSRISFTGARLLDVNEGKVGFSAYEPLVGRVHVQTPHGLITVSAESGAFNLAVSSLATEVHVSDGYVVVNPAFSAGGERLVRAGRAIRFGTGGEEAGVTESVTFQDDDFVQAINGTSHVDRLPALPVSRDLSLWLSAELLVKKDADSHVIGWGDILVGDNYTAENAWQPQQDSRPVWVRDGIGGRPALEFDGSFSYLMTSSIATTNDQTYVMVFETFEEPVGGREGRWRNQRFQSVLTSIGPPGLGLGVHMGTSRFMLVGQWRDGDSVGQASAAPGDVPANHPVIAVVIHNASSRLCQVFVNGQLVSQGRAKPSLAHKSPGLCIGMHESGGDGFLGKLAEVMFYKSALSEESRREVEDYLSTRYSIPLQSYVR